MSGHTQAQQRAEQIYLDSICYESDYKPLSLPKLKEALDAEGISSSTSSLDRWKKKFDWEEKAKQVVTAATVSGGEAKGIIEKSSMDSNVEKILTDFKANEAVKDSSYLLAQGQLKYYATLMEKNKHLSQDNIKIVIKLLELSTGREDKLLDRQTALAAAALANSTDVLAALRDEVIEVEVDE